MSKSRVAERSAAYALKTAVEPAFGTSFDLLAMAPQGVAKLRELILSLAVRGKLLPQSRQDEPAAASLARIIATKDRMVAEGVIKQHKAAGPIDKASKLFELPANWEWARLADLVAILNGRAYAKGELLSSGVPVLRVGNLFTSNHWYYSNLTLEPEKYCDVGDLLFAWSASFGPFIWPGPKAIYHYHIWKLNLHSAEDLNKNYLYTFLLKKTQEIKAAGHGVSMLHMTKEKMEKIVVPLPPLAEQGRIVARVEELMRLCDALEAHGRLQDEQHARLVATLFDALAASASAEELAENWQRIATHFDLLLDRPGAVDALEQTLLQLAVRGLLVPQDPTEEPASELLARILEERHRIDRTGEIKRKKANALAENDERPFELPINWMWVAFDEIVRPDKPIAYGVLVPGPDLVDGVPFVRLADISLVNAPVKPAKNISPDVDAQFERTRLEGGEILIGVVGSIGKLGVAPMSWKGANIARAICRIVPTHLVDKKFVIQLLQSEFMQTRFKGDTRTLAQPTLNVGLIRNCPMPLPPLAEQHRIVARVEQLRRLCADLRERLQQARATQSRLADALVSAAAQSPSC